MERVRRFQQRMGQQNGASTAHLTIMRRIEKDKHPFLMLVLLYSVTSSRSVSAPLRLLFASYRDTGCLLETAPFLH